MIREQRASALSRISPGENRRKYRSKEDRPQSDIDIERYIQKARKIRAAHAYVSNVRFRIINLTSLNLKLLRMCHLFVCLYAG